MKPHEPARRAEDSGFLHFYERWKVVGSALIGAVFSTWIAVTWADDKLRKVERVPAIEEAVLQLKLSQEAADRRAARLEERQAILENKMGTTQQAILERLDKLIDQRTR